MLIHDLRDHPKTFLKNNAVWVSGQMNFRGRGKAEIWPVTLVRASGVSCTRQGVNLPCWEIVPATSLSEHALAYFLPWAPNSTKEMTLGSKATLFITDTMNGCTFAGVGGPSPRVAHLNYNVDRQEGNPLDQGIIDGEITRLFTATPVKTLKKADYATSTFPNVTVLGTLRDSGWRFVYQKRDYTGATGTRNYVWKGVHSIR